MCNVNCNPNGCDKSDDSDYDGTVAVSVSGAVCLPWSRFAKDEIAYLEIGFFDESMIDMTILKENYCRNPNGAAAAWCYTDDWTAQFCDVSCDPDRPSALVYTRHQAIYTVGTTIEANVATLGRFGTLLFSPLILRLWLVLLLQWEWTLYV